MQDETIVVDLSIDAQQLKQLYRGVTRAVLARARDGRWVQFPALGLRAHVGVNGVHGAFALRLRAGRLMALERLG
jgi:hypothetical protein